MKGILRKIFVIIVTFLIIGNHISALTPEDLNNLTLLSEDDHIILLEDESILKQLEINFTNRETNIKKVLLNV